MPPIGLCYAVALSDGAFDLIIIIAEYVWHTPFKLYNLPSFASTKALLEYAAIGTADRFATRVFYKESNYRVVQLLGKYHLGLNDYFLSIYVCFDGSRLGKSVTPTGTVLWLLLLFLLLIEVLMK